MNAMRYNKLFLLLIASLLIYACGNSDNEAAVAPGGSTGQGGSMARFAIKENTLYVLGKTTLHVYHIKDSTFKHVRDISLQNDMFTEMETIFVNGDFLYMGATNGMYIYSITQVQLPTFVFRYEHILSCDPVVVQGNRAYVTMRGGNICNRGVNALDILDITDRNNPQLVESYPMTSPHGLGVIDNLLFVCEGDFGFKVFDITDEHSIRQIHNKSEMHAYDVILRPNQAIITGQDGIFQYRFSSDGMDLTNESIIPVSN